MPKLVWDRPEDRIYESGLDQGVLYLPDGSAVPWNGLTAVIEKFDRSTSPVYFDGMKINDLVSLGDFSATMKAVTYPDEFTEIEGAGSMRRGLFVTEQPPQVFGLCYRTKIGNELEGEDGYKIHVIYNVTAIPHDKTYATLSQEPSLVEFEWDITAVPEEVPGFHPTAHFVINSDEVDPWLLEDLEKKLYGSTSAVASLIPMKDLVAMINDWYRVKVVDNGDGTWTATEQRPGFITFLDSEDELFQITNINATYLDEETFLLSDTLDVRDVPQIRIDDNGDGTWSATTGHDSLFTVVDGYFEIRNANVVLVGEDSYRISDTTDED